METLVLDTATLPEAITKRIHASRVKMIDFKNGIALLPLENKPYFSKGLSPNNSALIGLLEGSDISSEDFSRRKQLEKELE